MSHRIDNRNPCREITSMHGIMGSNMRSLFEVTYEDGTVTHEDVSWRDLTDQGFKNTGKSCCLCPLDSSRSYYVKAQDRWLYYVPSSNLLWQVMHGKRFILNSHTEETLLREMEQKFPELRSDHAK